MNTAKTVTPYMSHLLVGLITLMMASLLSASTYYFIGDTELRKWMAAFGCVMVFRVAIDRHVAKGASRWATYAVYLLVTVVLASLYWLATA